MCPGRQLQAKLSCRIAGGPDVSNAYANGCKPSFPVELRVIRMHGMHASAARSDFGGQHCQGIGYFGEKLFIAHIAAVQLVEDLTVFDKQHPLRMAGSFDAVRYH